jgi:hypothetical protein
LLERLAQLVMQIRVELPTALWSALLVDQRAAEPIVMRLHRSQLHHEACRAFDEEQVGWLEEWHGLA